jgi:hypothetical protein
MGDECIRCKCKNCEAIYNIVYNEFRCKHCYNVTRDKSGVCDDCYRPQRTCPDCGGSGSYTRTVIDDPNADSYLDRSHSARYTCYRCNGSGKITCSF